VLLMFFYTIVISIGGGADLHYMLRELKNKDVDELDNGSVAKQPALDSQANDKEIINNGNKK
jgi:hypothetical protein